MFFNNMVQKMVTSFLVLVMILSLMTGIPMPIAHAATGEDVAIGNYIKFGKYNGVDIVWRVITKQDVNSDGVQELMLFSDKILTLKSFDAMGDYTDGRGDSSRSNYGSNYWDKSNIREWLNSTASTATYSHQKPDASHINGSNAYDTEKGFLNSTNFSTNEYNQIVPVTHKSVLMSLDVPVAEGGNTTHGYVTTNPSAAVVDEYYAYFKNSADRAFLLNIRELNDYVYSNSSLGDGNTYYRGKCTQEAINQSSYGFDPTTSDYWNYWLRDAKTFISYSPRAVGSGGGVGDDSAYVSWNGVRPAMFISKANIAINSGNGATAATAYAITSYSSPTPTSTLSNLPVGTRIMFGGKQFAVLKPSEGLVVSLKNIDRKTFNPSNYNTYSTTDSSHIGYYLNNTYYNSFPATEKALIKNSTWYLGNETNETASNTTGYIGLLRASEYTLAKSLGMFPNNGEFAAWWIVTPWSGGPSYVHRVGYDGILDNWYTSPAAHVGSVLGVRPALRILETTIFTKDDYSGMYFY